MFGAYDETAEHCATTLQVNGITKLAKRHVRRKKEGLIHFQHKIQP